jgi:hypothetical protein
MNDIVFHFLCVGILLFALNRVSHLTHYNSWVLYDFDTVLKCNNCVNFNLLQKFSIVAEGTWLLQKDLLLLLEHSTPEC